MKKDGSSQSSGRSESDKERTKLRERERRAITTRIFHGLRKFGGYHLSRRSDINQVLRELAKEAGWVVEPDGTTYRYKVVSRCPTCGVMPEYKHQHDTYHQQHRHCLWRRRRLLSNHVAALQYRSRNDQPLQQQPCWAYYILVWS
ncbi:hypothetical protein OIU84_024616 [Salix udensis]|uniref:Protein BZR1 homolog n=1 Tax=Salix udensis TaxID=889485 RepID=A0AAD6PBH2_9ROSI|nr:hypothetical protein OIU84_024616 [Salix udensis]